MKQGMQPFIIRMYTGILLRKLFRCEVYIFARHVHQHRNKNNNNIGDIKNSNDNNNDNIIMTNNSVVVVLLRNAFLFHEIKLNSSKKDLFYLFEAASFIHTKRRSLKQ